MKSLIFFPLVWKSQPARAKGSPGGIPHLPTDSCDLPFVHTRLSNDVGQGASSQVFHDHPELVADQVAGKQRRWDERAELNCLMKKAAADFCFQAVFKRRQNNISRHSFQAI